MELLLTIVAPGAEPVDVRVDIDPGAPGHELISAVAAGLRADPGSRAWVTRSRTQVLADRPVSEARLVHGDELVLAPTDAPPAWALTDPTMTPPAFELVAVGGPRAGNRWPLVVGREYVVGRDDTADVALDDAQASRRHVHLGVGSKAVGVTDLGSTNGTFLDGRAVTEVTDVTPGQIIEVGSTLLALEAPQTNASAASLTWTDGRLAYSRPPRVAAVEPERTVKVPAPPLEPPKRKIPVTAAVVPVLMGGVMAVVMGPIMLIFALLGPVMLGASTIEDRRSGRKLYRSQRERYDEGLRTLETTVDETHDALLRSRREAAPNPAQLVGRVRDLSPYLWERRPADSDFLALRIGSADLPSRLDLDVALPPPMPGAEEPTVSEAADRARVEALAAAHRIDPSVPVDVGLSEVGVMGIAGDDTDRDALLRWLVIQAATLSSPRDLAIVALVPGIAAGAWSWVRWLPHTETLLQGIPEARAAATGTDDVRALFQVIDDLVTQRRIRVERGGAPDRWQPHVLVVVPGEVPVPKPAMSRVMAEGPAVGVSFLVGASAADHLPGECRAVVRTTGHGNDTSVTLTASGDRIGAIVVDGLTLHLAADTARRLAALQDASASRMSGEVPRQVLLLDLLELPEPTSALVRERWAAHAGTGDLGAPIGVGAAGPVSVDLRRDGPHGLAAGTTGSGKSELLQSLIGSLAATYPASTLTFVLVDYKGGAAFKDCVALPHTVGFFTDLDTHLATRALVSLNAELRRREEMLREHGAKDLMELEQRTPEAAPANLFIVFDEFAFLKKEVPAFVAGVIDIAQRGRSLGVHLMLATQRPSGVVDDNIRANTNLRLALRMADEADSTDVLDRPDAAHIPKSLPGRCYLRLGQSEVSMVQSAYANARSHQEGSTRQPTSAEPFLLSSGLRETNGPRRGPEKHDDRPTDLQRLVAAVVAAHRDGEVPDQPHPWLDPLADLVGLRPLLEGGAPEDASELAAPLGVVDLPDEQAQRARWYDAGADGHLLVYGTSGTGKTQLLRTIATGLAAQLEPDDLHLYGLDFAGRGLASLIALPHTGGVVSADEPERVDRLFALLDDLVVERQRVLGAANAASLPEFRAQGGRLPHVVVLVDGYGAFHQTYLNVDRGDLVDRFARLVAQGRSVGLTFILTADRRNAIPTTLSSAITSRIVLRMADSDEYSSLGLSSALTDANLPPGRGFLDGSELQVAVLGDDPSGAGQAAAIATWGQAMADRHADLPHATGVAIVPDEVTLASLGLVATDRTNVPLALSGTSQRPVTLDLHDSPVFVIFGPDRSGRSTALSTIADGLVLADARTEAYLLAPRRSPLLERPWWRESAQGPDACADLARRLEDLLRERAAAPTGPWLVVIDDGDELVESLGANAISTLIKRGRDADLVVLASCQTHTAHRAFGGWITDVRKAKHGLILEPQVDLDGDLFGTRLPQKASRRFPPGRGYLIRRGAVDYVQVAR